jgi:hypothetical protein
MGYKKTLLPLRIRRRDDLVTGRVGGGCAGYKGLPPRTAACTAFSVKDSMVGTKDEAKTISKPSPKVIELMTP